MSLEKLTQKDNFHIPGNPNLAELAQSMKCLVSKPYYLQPSLPSVSQIERPHVTVDEIAKQQKTFDKEMAELKDHDEMISQFNIAIQGVWAGILCGPSMTRPNLSMLQPLILWFIAANLVPSGQGIRLP